MVRQMLLLLVGGMVRSPVVVAAEDVISKPTCCVKRAYCCTIKSRCCEKKVEMEIVR